MNRVSQIIVKILLVMIVMQFILILPTCQASNWEDIIGSGEDFLNEGRNEYENVNGGTINELELRKTIFDIYHILLTLGIVLSVVIGAILGVKYIIGSVEEQVKVKESLGAYVLGCIVIFGAFGIWRIVLLLLAQI